MLIMARKEDIIIEGASPEVLVKLLLGHELHSAGDEPWGLDVTGWVRLRHFRIFDRGDGTKWRMDLFRQQRPEGSDSWTITEGAWTEKERALFVRQLPNVCKKGDLATVDKYCRHRFPNALHVFGKRHKLSRGIIVEFVSGDVLCLRATDAPSASPILLTETNCLDLPFIFFTSPAALVKKRIETLVDFVIPHVKVDVLAALVAEYLLPPNDRRD